MATERNGINADVAVQAFANMPLGMFIADFLKAGCPIICANHAFSELTGYPAPELVGRPCWFGCENASGQTGENAEALSEVRAALERRQSVAVILRTYRADGTDVVNEVTVSPILAENGDLTRFGAVFVDVRKRLEVEKELVEVRRRLARRIGAQTADLKQSREQLYNEIVERLQAESSLKATEYRYRSIFENAVEGMYQSTPDGKYLQVNPALARMYGYSSPTELTDTISDIANEVYVDPAVRSLFKKQIETDGEVRRLEYQVRRRDGQAIWISESARVVKSRRGKVLFYEGTIQDITRRKQAEAEAQRLERELRQAQKMEAIGTLAGGIAHDFNNILGAIIGYAELSSDDVPAGSEAASNLKELLKAGRRAKELVQQILAFSRRDNSERRAVCVADILGDAISLLRAGLPPAVHVEQHNRSVGGCAIADPVQIHQVVMNLCTNAGYAMREHGGQLEVTLEDEHVDQATATALGVEAGDFLKLTVRDTGSGMPQETMDRMFEPFFTTKPVGEGTGLGLSVVHGIVRSHGGAIRVESSVGAGSTFIVYLPAATGAGTIPPAASELWLGSGERVLVVDDEPHLANIIKQQLWKLGYKAHAETDPVKALQVFLDAPTAFDLIVSDQAMPRMTGVCLASAMRQARPTIPIIICTGNFADSGLEGATSRCDYPILNKPIEMRQLSLAVHHALRGNPQPET